jgi:hypothetical protein
MMPAAPESGAVSSLEAFPYETAEELAFVIESARAALTELVRDWENGGHSHPRLTGCGDRECGYASCRLARALFGGSE